MNPTFRFLLIFALSLCAQVALAQDAPMRLALLYPPEAAPLGDLLTSELSKQQGVTLLEREQIRRIFEEKSLNAAQAKQDWAKIGELLGAEGLVILEPAENKSVSLRLVWAERGIIVHETAIDIDEKDPKKAVASALPQIEKAVRKLVDLRHAGKSAVAMHIKAVNADSGKDPDLRQGLGLLFAQRMLDEPGWVVVDRRNLTDAVAGTSPRFVVSYGNVTGSPQSTMSLAYGGPGPELCFKAISNSTAGNPTSPFTATINGNSTTATSMDTSLNVINC